MGALGHFLEREGIPTAGISLVREHTEIVRPPRALWVTFELGRPLGKPDDAAFQTRVLRAQLDMLIELTTAEIARLNDLRADYMKDSNPLGDWLAQDIQQAQQRLAWYRERLQAQEGPRGT